MALLLASMNWRLIFFGQEKQLVELEFVQVLPVDVAPLVFKFGDAEGKK